MTMEKISVLIPTWNEEQHIEAAIKSVDFADEIVVVDSFSTDKTLEIAQKFAHKVWQHEYVNSATQKNWAIPQLSHEWVFVLDADERVTPELKKEIIKIVNSNPSEVAFWIGRINYFMGKLIRYSGWQNDAVIRLFRKSKCHYQDLKVHSEVLAEGKVGRLKNKLVHYTYKDWATYYEKIDRYALWGARDRVKKIKKVQMFHLVLKPSFRFFKHYFIKAGFLDGMHGFVVSFLSGYSVFLRNLKLWRMKNGEKF